MTGNTKGWPSYDAAVQRWLPVSRQAVSPDGLRYAYTERYAPATGPRQAKVHVVDVRTGADRVVHDGTALAMIDFEVGALYLIGVPFDEGAAGLWRIDPGTGAITQISATGLFSRVQGGSAWFSTNGYQANDHLDRLDLVSGQTETWYSRPGATVEPVAFVSGLPVVWVGSGGEPGDVLLLESAERQRRLASAAALPGMFSTETYYVADSHGVWFGGGELRLLSNSGLRSFGKVNLVPAGACL